MAMDIITLLAETTQQTAQKTPTVADMPQWYLEMILMLSAISALVSVFVFRRQKKIAQNQVDTAQLIEHLMDRKK
jgi:hypothetical protein